MRTVRIIIVSLALGLSTLIPVGSAQAAPKVITFHPEVLVKSPKQAKKRLKKTPAHFKKFAGKLGRKMNRQAKKMSPECKQNAGVWVSAYHKKGFAAGAVVDCGGYRAIWKKNKKNKWREVAGTQDMWFCPQLKKAKVPAKLLGKKPECMKKNGAMVRYKKK